MRQPDEQVIRALAHIAQNAPAAKNWIVEQAEYELARLPSVTNNFAVAQGRCQVLGELRKLLIDAPDLVAQQRQPQPRA